MGGSTGVVGGGDIGAQVEPVIAIAPALYANGANNGTGVSRRGYDSMVLFARTGAKDATTFTSAVFKIQESSDDGDADAYADATAGHVGDVTLTISAVDTSSHIVVDLRGMERYVRCVNTVTATGGNASVYAAAVFVLAAKDILST